MLCDDSLGAANSEINGGWLVAMCLHRVLPMELAR